MEVGGRVETIQTTAFLRRARILRRVLETWCHSICNERPSAYADVKKTLMSNNDNNNIYYSGIYIKEQTEYIQNQIDKIRDSVEDRQSRIAWQTINEVSRRKNTAKEKLKAANQQERIKLWKQHFENLLRNPPKITHEPITRIISKQLDIKLGPFTQEELDSVLRKIKIGKLQGWTKFPRKYGRPDNSTTYCSDTATQYTIKIR